MHTPCNARVICCKNFEGLLLNKVYRLSRSQLLPTTLAQAWSFFVDPHNLGEITPSWLHFRLGDGTAHDIYEGQIIQYRITIPPGIPVRWTTEITHVVPQKMFVDEQRVGPYKLWHHQHLFRETEDGVAMEDIVHYAIGFGPIGSLVHGAYVARKLEAIFDYRFRQLEDLF